MAISRDPTTGKFVSSAISMAWAVSGIYKLQFPDGRFYIGSAQNIRARLMEHKSKLLIGKHRNPRLQRGWNKFGIINAVPVLVCRSDDLLFYEQLLMDKLNPSLNLSFLAGRSSFSDETRAKMSAAHKGKVRTAEHRLKLSIAQKGKPRPPSTFSAEANLKRSLGMMGKNKGKPGRKLSETELANLTKRMMGNTFAKRVQNASR